jgi:hypothetical protein
VGGGPIGGTPEPFTVARGNFDPIGGIGDIVFDRFGGGVDWAIPGFALAVPGLLVILAVLSQAVLGVVWLPFVRRWLGGFGVRRRRNRKTADATR